jgi:hypothetical protein
MDILFWKNLSNKIEIEYTAKQFYKQYLYRLEINAPGCKSIRSENISESIHRRKQYIRAYNQGSWFDKRLKEHLDAADIGFLHVLKDIIYEYPDIKIRTEEPKVTIYADSELMLQSIAKSISPDYRHHITSATGPENSTNEALLKNNVILVKRKPTFQYRVWFKEKQYDSICRNQIFSYLNELGDLVKLTDHTRDSLTKQHNWMWGCYFYTNDAGVADMVRLIHPDIIREVCELVYTQE